MSLKTQLVVCLFLALLIAVLMQISKYRRRRADALTPPATPATRMPLSIQDQLDQEIEEFKEKVKHSHGFSFYGINTSFFLGMIAALLIGSAVSFALPLPPFGKLAAAITIAILWMLWTMHYTPAQKKSAVFVFNAKTVRMGPGGRGFEPGINAMPLGFPIFTAENKYAGQVPRPFNQKKAYTKDNIAAMLSGTYQLVMWDIYRTYLIDPRKRDEEGEIPEPDKDKQPSRTSVDSLVLQELRSVPENFTARQLISQDREAGENEDKATIDDDLPEVGSVKHLASKLVYVRVMKRLFGEDDDAKWGYIITPALFINHIDLDNKYETSLEKESQERVERRAEETQIKARLDQIARLKAQGIDPNLAASIAQVEAEKPGAHITTVNIPGVTQLVDTLTGALKEWMSSKAGARK